MHNPCDHTQSAADGSRVATQAGGPAGGAGTPAAAEPGTPFGTPPPVAEVLTTIRSHLVEHELVLTAGATAIDVTTAMIMIPPSATLVGHRIGVEVCLLFREA